MMISLNIITSKFQNSSSSESESSSMISFNFRLIQFWKIIRVIFIFCIRVFFIFWIRVFFIFIFWIRVIFILFFNFKFHYFMQFKSQPVKSHDRSFKTRIRICNNVLIFIDICLTIIFAIDTKVNEFPFVCIKPSIKQQALIFNKSIVLSTNHKN